MARIDTEKMVFIVPVFENIHAQIGDELLMPATKAHVVSAVENKMLRPFRSNVTPKSHGATDYARWLFEDTFFKLAKLTIVLFIRYSFVAESFYELENIQLEVGFCQPKRLPGCVEVLLAG
jgi:hypothetical protein